MKKTLLFIFTASFLFSQRNETTQTNLNRAALSYPNYTNFTRLYIYPSTNAGIVTTNRVTNFILPLALSDPAFVSWLMDRIAVGLTNR